MVDIVLPGTRPSGDDQAWKREVDAALADLKAAVEAQASQIGGVS